MKRTIALAALFCGVLGAATIHAPGSVSNGHSIGGHEIPPDYHFTSAIRRGGPHGPVQPIVEDDEPAARVPPMETPDSRNTPEPSTAALAFAGVLIPFLAMGIYAAGRAISEWITAKVSEDLDRPFGEPTDADDLGAW